MKKFLLNVFIFIFILLPFGVSAFTVGDKTAGSITDQLMASNSAGNGSEIFADTSMTDIIAKVIKTFLSLLGIIFTVLMLLGGYNWMTAQGDESKVEKAKETIQRAVIGLIIVVSTYSITYTIFKAL